MRSVTSNSLSGKLRFTHIHEEVYKRMLVDHVGRSSYIVLSAQVVLYSYIMVICFSQMCIRVVCICDLVLAKTGIDVYCKASSLYCLNLIFVTRSEYFSSFFSVETIVAVVRAAVYHWQRQRSEWHIARVSYIDMNKTL